MPCHNEAGDAFLKARQKASIVYREYDKHSDSCIFFDTSESLTQKCMVLLATFVKQPPDKDLFQRITESIRKDSMKVIYLTNKLCINFALSNVCQYAAFFKGK